MGNKGLENEFVSALDVKDGKKIWSTKNGKVGNPDKKPNFPAARSTPTVDGALLYALGSDGDLVGLESATWICSGAMTSRLQNSRPRKSAR